MTLPDPLQPYATAIAWILRILATVVAAVLVWWAVVLPRTQLAAARADVAAEQASHAKTRADQAALLDRLALAAQAAAAKAANVKALFDAGNDAGQATYEKEVSDAYARGEAFGRAAAAGDVRVQPVWLDRECPGAAAGQGAGPARGPFALPADRAAALGRIEGIGYAADAGYALIWHRLGEAQNIVDACFDEPAGVAP